MLQDISILFEKSQNETREDVPLIQGKPLFSLRNPRASLDAWLEKIYPSHPPISYEEADLSLWLSFLQNHTLFFVGAIPQSFCVFLEHLYQSQAHLQPDSSSPLSIWIWEPVEQLHHWIKSFAPSLSLILDLAAWFPKIASLSLEQRQLNSPWHIYESPRFFQRNPHVQETWAKVLRYQQERLYNKISDQFFTSRWVKNTLQNLSSNRVLQALFPKTPSSTPVCIVGSGASVEDMLPLLQEFQDRVYILAGISVLEFLLQHHIIPDMVVASDGGHPNMHYIGGLKYVEDSLQSIAFVVYPHTSSHLVQFLRRHGSLYFIPSGEFWEESLFPQGSPVYPMGGSVAYLLLQLAVKISSSVIALGLDFAYTKQRGHVLGSRLDDLVLFDFPYQEAFTRYAQHMWSSEIFPVKESLASTQGQNSLKTDKKLQAYARVFVQLIHQWQKRGYEIDYVFPSLSSDHWMQKKKLAWAYLSRKAPLQISSSPLSLSQAYLNALEHHEIPLPDSSLLYRNLYQSQWQRRKKILSQCTSQNP